jgi:hypothetical protein
MIIGTIRRVGMFIGFAFKNVFTLFNTRDLNFFGILF